jgi:hypothetical protein
MPTDWSLAPIGVATLVLLNCLVSVRVAFAKTYSGTQKLLQLALVWLVPLLGVFVVYLFYQVDSVPRGPAEPPFGGGAGGPPSGAG